MYQMIKIKYVVEEFAIQEIFNIWNFLLSLKLVQILNMCNLYRCICIFFMTTVTKLQVQLIVRMLFSYKIVTCIWGFLAVVTNSGNTVFRFASYTWRHNRFQTNLDHLPLPEKVFLMKL